MAQTKQVSARERERRQAQRQAATSKVIFGEGVQVDIPGVGPRTLRYRNPDLALIERRLTPLLDDLPERIAGTWQRDGEPVAPDAPGATWVRYANVWEALEVLGTRYPIDTVTTLLYAALRHDGYTEADLDETIPPSTFRDPDVQQALGDAVGAAFGEGIDEGDAPRPTEAADSPAE